MSGIKYSQAVLSDTKKEEIRRNMLLREIREKSQKLESFATQFEEKHQFKFNSVANKIAEIGFSLDKQREKKTKADTTVYDRDLKNFAKEYQNDISQFNQIKESISEIEKNISSLDYIYKESKKLSGKRSYLDRAISKIQQFTEIKTGDSEYIKDNKKSYIQSLNSIRAGLNSWKFELVESAEDAERNFKEFKRKFKKIINEFKEVKFQNDKKYENALKVESANEDLKEYLRNTKGQTLHKKAPDTTTPNAWENILQRINRLKNMNLPDYFPESKQALESIDSFLKLMRTQKDYAVKNISERMKVLEGFSRKYKELVGSSENIKRNFFYEVNQLFKDEKNYTPEEKLELYKINETWNVLSRNKILKENDITSFRNRLIKFRGTVESRKLQTEEKNFIMETIQSVLIDLGYETSSISYPGNLDTEEVRSMEFRLSSTLRVKILISRNYEFLAQVIYNSTDGEISNAEMEEIRTEIKQWETDYDTLIEILQKDGIALNKKWMREIEKDSIIVEIMESNRKDITTKQIRREL